MGNKRKQILWISIVISCVIVMLLISILWYAIIFSVYDKILLISFIRLYLIVFCVMLKTRYQDYKAYRQGCEKPLQEPPIKLSLLCLSASSLLLLFYCWKLYQNSAQFSMIVMPLILFNVAYIDNYEMIIVEKQRLYFHHKWMSYQEIRKIDTDCSVKKYVVVYVFSDRTYTKRLEPKLYEAFELEVSKYYTNEFRKPK